MVEILRHGGHQPWRDEEQLRGGDNWQNTLLSEIEACDVFIYALTPHSFRSSWCNWEFHQAVHLRKPVVPVKLSRFEISGILTTLQYVDLTNLRNPMAAVDLVNAVQTARVSLLPTDLPDIPEPETHSRVAYRNHEGMTLDRIPLLLLGAVVVIAMILGLILLRKDELLPPIPETTLTLPPTQVAENNTPTVPTATVEPPTSTPLGEAPTASATVTVVITVPPPTVETPLPIVDTITVPTEMPSPTPQQSVEGVALFQANLRDGPGPLYGQVSYVEKGETIRIEGQNGLRDWYRLIERTEEGQQQWVWAQNVQVQGDTNSIPVVSDYPSPPSVVSVSTVCNPGQWFGVCGSNGCESEYVSKCNDAGTGYVCVWNPGECASESPSPFKPPARPSGGGSGDGDDDSCVCTQSWLEALIRSNGYDPADLIPEWDLDHDGKITCEDYKLQTGSYSC